MAHKKLKKRDYVDCYIKKIELDTDEIAMVGSNIDHFDFELKPLDKSLTVAWSINFTDQGIEYTKVHGENYRGFISFQNLTKILDTMIDADIIGSKKEYLPLIISMQHNGITIAASNEYKEECEDDDFLLDNDDNYPRTHPTWRELKNVTPENYEKWLTEFQYEPYIYDDFLQSFDWVSMLTKAMKKVAPLVGDSTEEAIILQTKYWGKLQSWELILNCLSVARALGTTFIQSNSWKETLESLKFWADGLSSHPGTRELVQNGASFLPDLVQFFSSNRTLPNPNQLSKSVLEHRSGKQKS